MSYELFELELLGGETERAYRAMRPEVEAMPWGTLDASRLPEEVRVAARRAWSGAAFQEHRTGAACALTLQALIEARAPVDLIALATRFPLDEMVHVELCARLAEAFGGGTEIRHDPANLVGVPGQDEPDALMRAAHLVVCYFCVGEALSIPMLHATWKAATEPLVRAVLHRIVLDEADHGTFGYRFLDWALPALDEDERRRLGATADLAIGDIVRTWEHLRTRPPLDAELAHAGGWLETGDYLAKAARALERQVLTPLSQRGIPLAPVPWDGLQAKG